MSGRIDQLESRVFLSIIHVDVSSPATTPDGATWATAYQDLQQALSGAGAGDQIWIADGTYKPTSGNDRFAWFRLKDRVSMFGGYAGYGAADPDRRDALVFTTTLSGDIASLGDNTDNSYHVVIGNNISAATTLDGLTIRWGNANGPDDGQTTFEDRGPAVFLNASSPLITNCTVTNHTAEFLGGISIDGGAPRLTYCRFANNGPVGVNAANGGGGGISAYEAIVSIEHCEFINNTMVQRGGGVMRVYSTVQSGRAIFLFCRDQSQRDQLRDCGQ